MLSFQSLYGEFIMTDGTQTTFRQRFFAKLMANEDDRSYEHYKDKKEALLSTLEGRVLEIGPGTGVNFLFYPKEIQWVGIEPNPAMQDFLKKKADESGFAVELISDISELSETEEGSFDYVVSTLVLCSVNEIDKLLQNAKRLLKLGGKFIFLEHVVDKKDSLRRLIQKTVPFTPWRYFSDGCNPGRDIASNIEKAGFQAIELHSYAQEGEGVVSWVGRPHIFGFAVK